MCPLCLDWLYAHYPKLEFAAGRLGQGSDDLAFDAAQSRDHDWGSKLDIFLEDSTLISELNSFFHERPQHERVCGYSTQFRPFIEQDQRVAMINVSNHEEGTRHSIWPVGTRFTSLASIRYSMPIDDRSRRVNLGDFRSQLA